MKLSVRYFFLLSAYLIFSSTQLFAQALPALQPEQDPCGALPLCGNSFYTASHYTGYGAAFSSMGCASESNSMWLKVSIATAGTVVFNLTPNNQYDDYDFSIADITSATCSTFTTANIVRCNANNNYTGSNVNGIIGLNATSTLTTVAGGTFGSSYVQQLTVNAGDVFLIMIDWAGNYANPSSTASGFTIDFSGSTATFVGGTPPVYDTIAASCDYRNGLTVHMTQPLFCSSLQANGSDFSLSPALATVSAATGAGCAGGTTQNITLSFSNPLPAGTYYLKAKNGGDNNTLIGQCNGIEPLTDSIMFVVTEPISVNAGIDTITCINNSLQLNAVVTGGPFSTVDVLWNPSTSLSSATILNPIATPSNDITYIVTVTPDGKTACAASDTIAVTVLQGFTLYNNDTVICNGAQVSINLAGDSRYTYHWLPPAYLDNPDIAQPVSTPDTTITYYIIVSHAGCNDLYDSLKITVEPIPTVFAGNDTIVCYHDTFSLRPVIIPEWFTNYSYSWSPSTGLNDPTVRTPQFKAEEPLETTLTVTTPAGCKGTDDIKIDVVPTDFTTTSGDVAFCPGDSAQLHIEGGTLYRWTPAYYISDATSSDPYVKPPGSTTYTVYAEEVHHCLDTQTIRVTVNPSAILSLPDTATLYYGQSFQLNPQTNCLYFSWFPPVGLSATNIADPIASPEVNTKYIVKGTTEAGCAVTDSMMLYVSNDALIDVSNAFMPGSDNRLTPVHIGNVQLQYFRIYDRWGKMVFQSSSFTDGWDGTLNGQPQPMGVYIYAVKATLPGGKLVEKQGNVTLIR